MKKDLIAMALVAGLGIASLGACTTISELTPEEQAQRRADRIQDQADRRAFEDLKKEFDTGMTDPQ